MIKVNSLDFLNKEVFGIEIQDEMGTKLYSAEDKVTPDILLKLYFSSIFIQDEADVEDSVKGFFDEEEATNVVKYSLIMADLLGYSENDKKDLEVAAYNHNIGTLMLAPESFDEADFVKTRSDEGYKYLKNQKGFSDAIANVSKLYLDKYNCNKFDISKKNKTRVPFHHIVAIANSYNTFLKTMTKEESIMKLLRLGGNKFNIYILHKFINKMRNTND